MFSDNPWDYILATIGLLALFLIRKLTTEE